MNIHVHLLTDNADPDAGGMERSVCKIADMIASFASRVTVYSRFDRAVPAVRGKFQVVLLRLHREKLLLPQKHSENHTADLGEIFRLDGLLLRNEIAEAKAAHGTLQHILVSFFASTTGFVAQQLAFELELPHIACVRGSDFSRDFRNPYAFSAMEYVNRYATVVVTTNADQRSLLSRLPHAGEVITILNSTEENLPEWRPHPDRVVQLVADCGYSLKKGTHLLISAVHAFAEKGHPVCLNLFGRTNRREREFWSNLRADYSLRAPHCFRFRDFVEIQNIADELLISDIYCSASLAEGCSNSVGRALAVGIPIVSSKTGSLPELAREDSHVRMFVPGSESDLLLQLELAVMRDRIHTISTDQGWLKDIREALSAKRELLLWQNVLARFTM